MKVKGRRREVSMDICCASQNFSGRVQIEFEAENLKQHLVDFPRGSGGGESRSFWKTCSHEQDRLY